MRLAGKFAAAFVTASVFLFPATANGNGSNSAVTCIAPDYSAQGGLRWFLGLHPADDLLSTWCRIQALPGNVRFNILFPETGAHRSWDTSFEGGRLPASRIVELVQSLLPVGDGPARDENGMEFPKVLENVHQLASEDVGFASDHPSAKELVLLEPVVLRVRPVALAGEEFTMMATLKPNLGLLALGLQGKATDVRFRGWIGRMKSGSFFGNGCSDQMPLCDDLGESPPFHAPWLLDSVVLAAEGENMTEAAAAIMNQLAAGNPSAKISGPRLDTKTGNGSLTITDGNSTMTLKAAGSQGGTKSIRIEWRETNANGIHGMLNEQGRHFRIGIGERDKAPPVPDSLGLL